MIKAIRKFRQVVLRHLKLGSGEQQVTSAVLLGFIFGTIPLFGVSTVLLFIISPLMRLNLVIVQLANYLVYPIQLITYMPMLYLGMLISGNAERNFNFHFIKEAVQNDWKIAIIELGELHLWGIIIWIIIWIPSYLFLRPVLFRWIVSIKYQIASKN